MNKASLRFAGMFQELGRVGLDIPQESIFDHVANEALPDVEQVVSYLRSGYILIDMMDLADDPLEPSQKIMDGSSILTDGDWLWREDLAYFVRRHHVTIPADFLSLIRARDYTVPQRDEAFLGECANVAEELAFGKKR